MRYIKQLHIFSYNNPLIRRVTVVSTASATSPLLFIFFSDPGLVLDNSDKFYPRGTGAAGSVHNRLLSAPPWGICRALTSSTDFNSSDYGCTPHSTHVVSAITIGGLPIPQRAQLWRHSRLWAWDSGGLIMVPARGPTQPWCSYHK